MPVQLGERGRKGALIDTAEAGKAAGAVNQHLIPDPARVSVDHPVAGEIKTFPDEVVDDIVGIVGDAFSLVMVNNDDDVAVNSAAENGARLKTERGSLLRDLNLII